MTAAASAPAPGALSLGALLLRTTPLTPEQLDEARARAADQRAAARGACSSSRARCATRRSSRRSAAQLGLPVRAAIAASEIDADAGRAGPDRLRQGARRAAARARPPTARSASPSPIPSTPTPLDDLRLLFDGAEVEPELASRSARSSTPSTRSTTAARRSTDALAEDASEDLDALASARSAQEPQDLLESADDAPIIRLVNSLLQHAVKERASDIHIEPFEREIRVRFRDRRHPLRAGARRCRARCRRASSRASRSWAA